MINFFLNLYYRYYNWRYDVPSKRQIEGIYLKYYYKKDLKEHRSRYRGIMVMYIQDWPLEEIAKDHQCTRERIRQILWKISRDKPNEYWYNRP